MSLEVSGGWSHGVGLLMEGGVGEEPASSRNTTRRARSRRQVPPSVSSKWEVKQEEKGVQEEVFVGVSLLGH